jgi:hypothetical protein
MNSYLTTASYYFQRIRDNIPTVVFVYFGIVLAHYISSNVYPIWCCNNTLIGFIMTPFMIVAPHCEALRWIIHYTGEQIRNVWWWLAGYLVYYVTSTITSYLANFRVNVRPDSENNHNISLDTEENVKRRTRSSVYNNDKN